METLNPIVHLQMHEDWLTLRVEGFRFKEWIATRLSLAVPATLIRANHSQEGPFADSPKKTVIDFTKGYDEGLRLILP
jgi:hypothetical protein